MVDVRERVRVTGRLNTASVADTLRVMGTVLGPAAARGAILRRPRISALTARLDVDRRAARALVRLRDRYGDGPLRLRLPKRRLALVLSPADVGRVLTEGPEPFSPANREKRGALSRFQPHGVLISAPQDRPDRRRFTETVLDTDRPVHRMSAAITDAVAVELRPLLDRIAQTGRLDWDTFTAAHWRMVRRVVLGAAAAGDTELTELLDKLRGDANWAYFIPKRRRLRDRFRARLRRYLGRPDPNSLAALIAATPSTTHTDPESQIAHWLFAFDALGIANFRALAMLASHPEAAATAGRELTGRDLGAPQDLPFLRSCVQESVRLWPTTLVVLRDTTAETRWNGDTMPAGTGLVIVSSYFHRDDRLPYAHRFTPEIWLDGRAEGNWSLVPFSGGPAVCAGRNLVTLIGSLVLGHVVQRFELRARHPRLDAGRPLPHTLDHVTITLDAEPIAAAVSR